MRQLILLMAALGMAGCATTPEEVAEQRAWCERMEGQMGLQTAHDHQQMKGVGANPMNLTHEQCQHILASPSS